MTTEDHPSISVEQLLLLRREQRNLLKALPQRKKYAKLASCRHCDSGSCRCPGWVPSSADTFESEVESQGSEASAFQNCKTCGHEMDDHGCDELKDKSEDEIFNLLCLSQDVVTLYSAVQNQTDPDAKQIYFYVYKQLRRALDVLQVPTQFLFKPVPPFEQAPSISQLLANFVSHHFISQSSSYQINQEEVVQIAALFLDVFDVWKFPAVSLFNEKLTSKENKEYYKEISHGNDLESWYRTVYSQWLCHCRIPSTSARLSLPCWRASSIYGIKMLRYILPVYRDELIAHCKEEKFQKELITKITRFINVMVTDIKTNRCDWAQTDFTLAPLFSPKFLGSSAMIDKGIFNEEKRDEPKRSESPSPLLRKRRKTIHDDKHEEGSAIEGDVSLTLVKELMKVSPAPKIQPTPSLHHANQYSTTRDEKAKMDYLADILSVHVVNNVATVSKGDEKSSEETMFLLAAQNIFTAQLPRMPRPYVSRLVFDPKHRTLCLVKKVDPSTPIPRETPPNSSSSHLTPTYTCTRKVIGAICFCAFPERRFSEIVFCAVSAEEQVRGFGTFMMSCVKEWHVRHGYKHLLTFADEFAVGYFLKQGFSSDIKLPREHYEGFIKDYEGATLMECQLEPLIPYTHIAMGVRQTKRIVEMIAERKKSEVGVKRTGLSCFDDGVKQIPIESIPGVVESGWNGENFQAPENLDQLNSDLRYILNQVKQHANAWPFLKPVDPAEAPDYLQTIKFPMDLKTIGDRLKNRYYHHKRLFIADFQRMFENCRSYNAPSTEYYKCANSVEKFFTQKLRESNLL